MQRVAFGRDVFVHVDELPSGEARFTYVRMNGPNVLAFADFVFAGFEDELPVFQVGVAVPEAERGKGRAKHIVAAGIAELKHGFNRTHPDATFYIEAVVGLDNVPSQHVAAAVISGSPKPITDAFSGLPALHYIRKV